MVHKTPYTLDVIPRQQQRGLGIQARLFFWQILAFALLALILLVIQVYVLRGQIQREYGERALGISRTVAEIPTVVEAFGKPNASALINPLVNRIRGEVGADFIVVGDSQGIRLAHPLPDRLGKPMVGGDNGAPLSGREIISVATGTLGTSIRGKVPIRDATGKVIGVVSTGYLLPSVQAIALRVSLTLLPWFGLALLFALLSSMLISRRIKREMLDLEPDQIAALVLQHRTVLSALQEGVLVVDNLGEIHIMNTRAAKMLGLLPDTELPLPLRTVWPELYYSRLVVQKEKAENWPLRLGLMPVLVTVLSASAGQRVVVFGDRVEIMRAAEELTQVKQYADLLRAQTHEFMNRLHTIAGLIQLGRSAEALEIIHSQSKENAAQQNIIAEIEVPRLAALILGKYHRARELNIDFSLEAGSALSASWTPAASDMLVLVVGNLLENAFEAVRENPKGVPPVVVLLVGEDPEGLQVEVRDNGPGVPASLRECIFEAGVSTRGPNRGLGLSLVKQQIVALGGSIVYFRREGFTVFQASLPRSTIAEVQEL